MGDPSPPAEECQSVTRCSVNLFKKNGTHPPEVGVQRGCFLQSDAQFHERREVPSSSNPGHQGRFRGVVCVSRGRLGGGGFGGRLRWRLESGLACRAGVALDVAKNGLWWGVVVDETAVVHDPRVCLPAPDPGVGEARENLDEGVAPARDG